MLTNQVLQLIPEYRDYVWGGDRLRPGIVPTAEAWLVYEGDRVARGPQAGRTLADLTAEYGAQLVGHRAFARTGARFPLLIKLLDCVQWLSLQVHPDDEQAARLEGPGEFGKTEAWHVLEAAPNARVIAGLKSGVTADALAQAIRAGTLLDLTEMAPVAVGDTVFVAAGTVHALGPGLLIYEVQQTSDLTYRVWDWDRPLTPGRVLHLDKSIAVASPTARAEATPLPPLADNERVTLCACPYFTLDMVAATEPMLLNTKGDACHALTVVAGALEVRVGDETVRLSRFDTALIPAAVGAYGLVPDDSCRILLSYP